ncbi:MAG: hypothetical protein BIFFINMI_02646 [Phycisphaerae bacterium]|nr:hypothetical protein [Phycisphaerae bacterium]
MKGSLLVADAAGQAAVPEVVREHWEWLEWFFETSGTAALARLRQFRPDLVIANLQLPDMCGAELVERIKRGRPNQRILVTSNTATRLSERVARTLGVVGYFPKPLDPQLFEDVLAATVGGSERLARRI